MTYVFNFENRERPMQFNMEKLLLSALQNQEQLYYMMDTQYDGIYQAEAVERKRQYGPNSFMNLIKTSKYRLMSNMKYSIEKVFKTLYSQKIAVFRRGFHFYKETYIEDIVPGDIIFISPGDIIPADIRIIFSEKLKVDQSIYTNSKGKVEKSTTYDNNNIMPENITEVPNLCFVGTSVYEGVAKAVVISTGEATYLGHLLLM